MCREGGATGTTIKLEILGSYKALRTNHALADAFRRNAENLGVRFETTDEALMAMSCPPSIRTCPSAGRCSRLLDRVLEGLGT